jgi:segregation and condensation protein A
LEDYRVELDYYSGPLDLLLFLVKKDEIDLHDIPIAQLTEQYLHHLETIQRIDINLASEFLVMAATLLEIKSQMLAPKVEADEGEGEAASGENALNALDPRYELVKQLLAYKRFKDAANSLDARREEWDARFPYRPAKLPKPALRMDDEYVSDGGPDGEIEDPDAEAAPVEIDLEDVSITDLCEAFARILESIGQAKSVHAVTYDDTPISLHAEDIHDRLKREGPLTLQAIFIGRRTRGEMIGLFLATLELVRQKKIKVKHDRIAGEIAIELRPEAEQLQVSDDAATSWTDPVTGEVQYEWPSDNAKQRAEKRAARRLLRAMGKHGEEEDEECGYIEIKRDGLDELLNKQAEPLPTELAALAGPAEKEDEAPVIPPAFPLAPP